MFGRERGEKSFCEKRESIELMAADGQGQEGDVHGARAEAVEQDGRDFLDDGSWTWGNWREKGRDAEEESRARPWDRPDGNRAADGVFALDNVALGGFEFAKDGAGAGKEGLAQIGEADGAAKAVEEPGAEFGFELEDLLGKRRLGTCDCSAARLKVPVSATAQK